MSITKPEFVNELENILGQVTALQERVKASTHLISLSTGITVEEANELVFGKLLSQKLVKPLRDLSNEIINRVEIPAPVESADDIHNKYPIHFSDTDGEVYAPALNKTVVISLDAYKQNILKTNAKGEKSSAVVSKKDAKALGYPGF